MAVSARNLKRIRDLHAIAIGSHYPGERESARAKLDELLQKLKLNWNDLPRLLSENAAATGSDDADEDAGDAEGDAFLLTRYTLQEFIQLKPVEYVAITLWAMHTHVYERFLVTPRLGLLSPVKECGKTTLLILLEQLTARPLRSDDITPAALYHHIDDQCGTLLLDEIDNANLLHNPPMRKVLNSGHRQGGNATRMVSGKPRLFSTFAPVALAAITSVTTLPLPLLSRSIVIRMQRATGRSLRRLGTAEATRDLNTTYRHIFMWARSVKLDPDPDLPPELVGRNADNWRPLIAIADAFGHGDIAREAALALTQRVTDEDVGVQLLIDIRAVFDAAATDRIASADLVKGLRAIEDSIWNEGRALTQNRLALMLRPFGIEPRTFWPPGPRRKGSSRRGYWRSQFPDAWAAYCPEDVTPSQANPIRQLSED